MDLEISEPMKIDASSQGPQRGLLLSRNDQKWESLQEDIRRVYMTENNTLPKTMLMIEEQHDFKASPRKWKVKLKEWGYEKHLSENDMKIVVAKVEKRKIESAKGTVVFHNGIRMPTEKIENFKRRKVVRESEPASPSADTPAAITYSTPRLENDCLSPVKYMDDISEHVQRLNVSQPCKTNSSGGLQIDIGSEYVTHLDVSQSKNERCAVSRSNSGESLKGSLGKTALPAADNMEPHVDQEEDKMEFEWLPDNTDRAFDSIESSDHTPRNSMGLGRETVIDKYAQDFSHIGSVFLEAVDLQARTKEREGRDRFSVYKHLSEVAETRMNENRLDSYIAIYSLVVIGYKNCLGFSSPPTLRSILALADALKAVGSRDEARDLYAQAVEGYKKCLYTRSLETVRSTIVLALTLKQSRPSEALVLYDQAVRNFSNKYWTSASLEAAERIVMLADAASKVGGTNEAQDLYREALEGYEEILLFAGRIYRGITDLNDAGLARIEQPFRQESRANILHFNLQCLSIRYLEIELQADSVQANPDIINLLDNIRSLYWKLNLEWDSHPWCWFLSYASSCEGATYPNQPEDTEIFLTKFGLISRGMDLARHYSVYGEFDAAERLFFLILNKFESLDPAATRFSIWKAEFCICYASHLYRRRNYFGDARCLVVALKEFIRLDCLTGHFAFYVRWRLRAVPERLEEDEENWREYIPDLTPNSIIQIIEKQDGGPRRKAHVGRSPAKPVVVDGGNSRMKNTMAYKDQEYERLLKSINEVESLVGSIVAPNKDCMICLGNCLCPPDL